MRRLFKFFEPLPNFQPRCNVTPTQLVSIVRRTQGDVERELALVPHSLPGEGRLDRCQDDQRASRGSDETGLHFDLMVPRPELELVGRSAVGKFAPSRDCPTKADCGPDAETGSCTNVRSLVHGLGKFRVCTSPHERIEA